MSRVREPGNPFYIALIVVGIAFTLTACLYTYMMVSAIRFGPAAQLVDGEPGPLLFLEQHGALLLGLELALLAIAMIGAIGVDHLLMRRTESQRSSALPPQSPGGHK